MKKVLSLMLALVLVLACLSGLSFAADAEATWTDGTTTAEGTLIEMAKQANKSGGTIKLLKDVNHEKESYPVASATSFTLDLNGHTLSSAGSCVTIGKNATGTTVIKNGTLIGKAFNISVDGGALQLKNVTMHADKQNINYNVTDGKYSADNLIEGCTIVSNRWGAFSFNRNDGQSQAAMVMVVRNSNLVAVAKSSDTIVMQSKAVAANVVLAEGVKMYTVAAKTAAPIAGKISVTGEKASQVEGLHSITVLDQTYENLTLWATPDTATMEVKIPEIKAEDLVVPGSTKASWTNGISSAEGTLKEMVAMANKSGGTVKLLEDVNDQSGNNAVTVDNAFTLDLNGHKLQSTGIAVFASNKVKGVTVITDSVGGGAIISEKANLNIRGGGIHVKGVTMWSTKSQNINYYDVTDTYNHQNLIEDSVIGSAAWCTFSFNNTEADQAAASMTVKNSTLVAARTKGSTALDRQNKPEGSTANIVLGEGVKMYTYSSGDVIGKALNRLGETYSKTSDQAEVTVLGETYAGLKEYTTPETATVDLATVIPGKAPEVTPSTPATPAEPTTPSAPAEDKKEETKQEVTAPVISEVNDGAPVGLIIGIVAAVVVIAAVVLVVLKKKKN